MIRKSLAAVHLEDVDVQHSRLRQYIAALERELQRHEPSGSANILADLSAYAEMHFADEEQFMRTADYSGLEEHADAHCRLLAQVRQLQRAVKSGRADVTHATVEWLHNWVEDHTGTLDAQYLRECIEVGQR